MFLWGVTALPRVLYKANQWVFSGLQGGLAGTFWSWLCSEVAVCLSVELPAATSGTRGLWQQCHSLAGAVEFQPSSQVMGAVEAVVVDEGSSFCLGFCGHPLCQGVQSSTGLGPHPCPHPAVNLGCNSALLGAGDSPPASSRPALTQVFPVPPPWQLLQSQSLGWLLLAQPEEGTKGPKAVPRGGTP